MKAGRSIFDHFKGARMKAMLCPFCFLVASTVLPADAHPGLTVRFIEPEHFTDVSLSGSTTDKMREHVLAKLEKYLHRLADAELPKNDRLEIDIKDIDMAGAIEPWQAPELINTRIIRDIYWPLIKLHYRWQNEKGNLLEEADETVSDKSYLRFADPSFRINDPLRYEKTLLMRWFEKRFGNGKKPYSAVR